MTGVLAGPWDGSAISATVRPPYAPVAVVVVVGAPVVVVVGAPVVPIVGAIVVVVRDGLAPHAATRVSTATRPRAARTPTGYLALADAWLETGPVPTRLVAATS